MGARRKIVPLTRDYAGKDPVLDLTDDYLRVTLPARAKGDSRDDHKSSGTE